MAETPTPRVWNAFIVPSALCVFYCVVLCLSYPHMASMIPTRFNAAGSPDGWTATGPILFASLVAIGLVYWIFGIAAIRSAENRRAWWITSLILACAIGALVGASVEFIHAVHSFREFHSFWWIAWGVIAALVQALFLLIPRRQTGRTASSANI